MSETAKPAPAKRQAIGQRTFTVTLTISRALSAVLALALSFLWFFIMGVFLGRGYEPEQHFTQLAEYLPQTSQTRPAGETLPPLDVSAPDKTTPVPSLVSPDPSLVADATKDTTAQSSRAVINEADKAYREALGQQQAAGTPPPALVPLPQNQPPKPAVSPTPAPPATADQDTAVYNYEYQVASFKEEAPARAMADKLIKGGVRARVAKASGSGGKTWHRVVVDHKGNPDSVTELRENLKKFKIEKILLVTKKKG